MTLRASTYTFLAALIISVAAALLLASCGAPPNDAENRQRQQTEALFDDMDRAVGMPAIVNYAERRQAKRILELRDQNLPTYSYFVSMTGEYVFLCESVGFGIPASVQYTNPVKHHWARQRAMDTHFVASPQADPNGLYMPDGLSATYVMCADPGGGEPTPVYVEPPLLVSPFRLGR